MKKYLFLFLLSITSMCRASSLTATITDTPDGNVWANGTCRLVIYSPNGTPTVAGTPLTAAQKTPACTMNGSGVLSAAVTDTSTITPAGALWTFTICPNATSGCFSTNMAVTGSSPDLSTALSALANSPRFPAGPSAYGYADAEITPTPLPGGTYYNVTTPAYRQWNGSAWATVGSGGGNIAGLITATGCTLNATTGLCTVTSPVSSVTLSSIPAIGNKLEINFQGGNSSAPAGTNVTFNGDSAAHYNWAGIGTGPTLTVPGTPVSAGAAFIQVCALDSADTIGGTLTIPFYASSMTKTLTANCFDIANGPRQYSFGGNWTGTAAITSITFTPASNNFTVGTVFRIAAVN
jgi:hypothetical protein